MPIHAACCRCHSWFEFDSNPSSAGFFRDFVGLCGKCKGEVGNIDEALARVRRRVKSLSEDAKGWRREYNKAVARGDAARDRIWGFGGSAFDFFSAIGKIALAAEGLSVPGTSSAASNTSGIGADPATGWEDLRKELSKGTWPPPNLPETPFDPPPGMPGATAAAASNPNRKGRITSLHTHVTPYNGEWDSFDDAVHHRKEIPVRSPAPPAHRSNRGGPDSITAGPNGRNAKQLNIYCNDASTSIHGKFKKPSATVKKTWIKKYVVPAVESFTGPKATKDKLRAALREGRVLSSQANVDYTPGPRPTGRPNIQWYRQGKLVPPSRGSRFSARGRALGSAADKVGKVFDVADSLREFAGATDSLSNDMGEYFTSRREAADWQRLLDDIDRRIEEATKEIGCLQGEKDFQERNANA